MRQRVAEKSSLRDEAKMPPPQASGQRGEFDLPEVSFVVNIQYLIRGGAEGIQTAMLLAMRRVTAASRERVWIRAPHDFAKLGDFADNLRIRISAHHCSVSSRSAATAAS